MSIQTNDDATPNNDGKDEKPVWYGPTGTARETYEIEISPEIGDDIIEHYDEENVDVYDGINKRKTKKVYSGEETVGVRYGENTWAFYSRPKDHDGSPDEELIAPLLEETRTDKDEFKTILD
ncbi:MAG: hypothetical protein ABEJ72_04560 [Candidatus Aenigmatarchaeota archaeon]